MIRAVIFDCFGVLYVDPSKYFFEQHIVDFERLRPQIEELFRACDRGYVTQQELNQEVARITSLPLDFVSAHIQGVHQRNDELLQFAQSLRGEHKVGMLSNIGRGSMDTFFDETARTELFDAVVLSGDVGVIKPDPAIYEIIAEKLGVTPQECVMIDDIARNVDGAVAAGMQGVLYESTQQVIHDVTAIAKAVNA